MRDDIHIRKAIEIDFSQWRSLWDQYNAFYGRAGPTALSEDIVLSTWNRFHNASAPLTCLVAEYNDRLVGFAHYIFHPNTILIENTAYLQDLFSDPSVQGMGIGRALLTSFFERSKDEGVTQIYWHTHSSNNHAKMLYDDLALNTEFNVYRKSL